MYGASLVIILNQIKNETALGPHVYQKGPPNRGGVGHAGVVWSCRGGVGYTVVEWAVKSFH